MWNSYQEKHSELLSWLNIYLLLSQSLKICRYIMYTTKVLAYFFSSRNTQSQYKNVVYSHHNIIKGIIIFYMWNVFRELSFENKNEQWNFISLLFLFVMSIC